MSRIWRCDYCGSHMEEPRDVRVVRGYSLPDDEGFPFREAKIAGKKMLHACVPCFTTVGPRDPSGVSEASPHG